MGLSLYGENLLQSSLQPFAVLFRKLKFHFINTNHRTFSSENRELEERTEARAGVEDPIITIYSPFTVIIGFVSYVNMHPNHRSIIGFDGSVGLKSLHVNTSINSTELDPNSI